MRKTLNGRVLWAIFAYKMACALKGHQKLGWQTGVIIPIRDQLMHQHADIQIG